MTSDGCVVSGAALAALITDCVRAQGQRPGPFHVSFAAQRSPQAGAGAPVDLPTPLSCQHFASLAGC
jgi:hypothetical protein